MTPEELADVTIEKESNACHDDDGLVCRQHFIGAILSAIAEEREACARLAESRLARCEEQKAQAIAALDITLAQSRESERTLNCLGARVALQPDIVTKARIFVTKARIALDDYRLLESRLAQAEARAAAMREALEAIAEALKEPRGGSYWPARKYLDDRGVYNTDLADLRVINAVATAALSPDAGRALLDEVEKLRALITPAENALDFLEAKAVGLAQGLRDALAAVRGEEGKPSA